MQNNSLEDQLYPFLFGVRRSIRYHYRRVRFFDGTHKTTTFLSALSGTAAVAAALSTAPREVASIFAAIVAFFSVIDLVIGSARKARRHNDFARRYFELEKKIIREEQLTEKMLKDFKVERLDIEMDEPPPRIVLNLICHNEQLRADGRDKKRHIKLTWCQRLFAHLIDIREYAIKIPS